MPESSPEFPYTLRVKAPGLRMDIVFNDDVELLELPHTLRMIKYDIERALVGDNVPNPCGSSLPVSDPRQFGQGN